MNLFEQFTLYIGALAIFLEAIAYLRGKMKDLNKKPNDPKVNSV